MVSFYSFYRMQYNQYAALCLIALVLGQVAALPQHSQYTQQYPQLYQSQQVREERKFAEKPNAMKKVAIDDLEDISTNQIQVCCAVTRIYYNINVALVNVASREERQRQRLNASEESLLCYPIVRYTRVSFEEKCLRRRVAVAVSHGPIC